ncbi:hypothetical protein DYU05_06095 [Mucilaginibacter terrenus]|uniref:Uncharacterized protein n=1 Tax=Mucilaginibacter terrenus TaxID=2482727 RepID=A0A3E2NW25_9SPHI|nr:hypothetical protein DYU05_06095 [Mucilaginibacter terrenus]
MNETLAPEDLPFEIGIDASIYGMNLFFFRKSKKMPSERKNLKVIVKIERREKDMLNLYSY